MRGNLLGLLLVVAGGLMIFLALTGRYRNVGGALKGGPLFPPATGTGTGGGGGGGHLR